MSSPTSGWNLPDGCFPRDLPGEQEPDLDYAAYDESQEERWESQSWYNPDLRIEQFPIFMRADVATSRETKGTTDA